MDDVIIQKDLIPPKQLKASLPKAIQGVSSTATGSRKILKLGKIISKWGKILSHCKTNDFFDRGIDFFGAGYRALIVPKIPKTANDFVDAAYSSYHDFSPTNRWKLSRKTLEVFRDAFSLYSLFVRSLKILYYSYSISIAADLMDFKNQIDHLSEATDRLPVSYIDQSKANPLEVARHALLRLVKYTALIALDILRILRIILGVCLVCDTTLLVLSTVSVVFCLTSKIYKEMMTHRLFARQIEIKSQNFAVI